MDIEHLILAAGTSIDQERNSVSVFDLLEDLNIQTGGGPVQIPFQILVVLKREPAETGEVKQNFRFQIVGADGVASFDQQFAAQVPADQRRFRMRAALPLNLTRSGLYRFVLSRVDSPEVVRETDVIVKLSKAEPGPGQPQ
jgi:hypothetical protein